MKKKGASRLLDKDHVGYLFILPSCLIIFIFTIIPAAGFLCHQPHGYGYFPRAARFPGPRKLRAQLRGRACARTLSKTRSSMCCGRCRCRWCSRSFWPYWLYRPTRFNKLCRSIYYVPVLCSFTAIGILFNLILNSTVGYIPYIVSLFSGSVTALLSDVRYAMPIILFISIWKSFGKTVIILVAGINDIPYTLYEASAIDGREQNAAVLPHHAAEPHDHHHLHAAHLAHQCLPGVRRRVRHHRRRSAVLQPKRWCSTSTTAASPCV